MTIPNQSKSAEEPDGQDAAGSLLLEARLAIATLTLWPLRRQHAGSSEQRARATVFIPLAGFSLGIAMALVDRTLEVFVGPLARSAMVIALALVATGGLYPIGLARTIAAIRHAKPGVSVVEIGPGNWLIAIAAIGLEIVCLASIVNAPARARAIVLAMMLSRWAIVPIAYGLRPLDPSGLGLPYEGGIQFREFAVGSVIGLGLAMGLYDIVALAAIVALALTILLLRLVSSRALGGVSGYALAAGAVICELVVLAVLATLRI